MTSLWTDLATADETEPAPTARYEGAVMPGDRFDVAVVGAGITGLATAIMLQRGGSRVVVLEADRVAALATGANTGKASVLQGAMLQRIRRSHPARVVRAYVDANLDGLRWITEFAQHHGVPVSEETAYSYAATDEGLDLVDREFAAAFEAGLPVERVERMPVPFPFAGAVALPGQLGLDPYRLAVAMARAFVAEGGVLLEGMRVEAVHADRPVELRTPHGTIRADAAVIATAAPTLLRGLYFAKTRPLRSHLTSYRVDAAPPPGLFITVDAPTRSVRTTPDRDPDAPPLLIVGGNGHPVGRVPSTEARVRDLVSWTGRYFPGAELTHRWAAQDYESANLVPFVGRMPRGLGRIWVATGFAKWGLTNGAAAAIRISEEMLGVPWRERRDWIRVLGTRVDDARRPRARRRGGSASGAGDRRRLGRRGGAPGPGRHAGRGRGRGGLPQGGAVRDLHGRRSHVRRARRVQPPRRRAAVERRRDDLGLSAARLALRRIRASASRAPPCTTCRRSPASATCREGSPISGRAPHPGRVAERPGRSGRVAHAAEPDVRRRRVVGLGRARRGPVAQAVLGGAQVRAALQHPARDARARLGGCRGEQVLARADVDRHLAGHLVPRGVEVRRPLPHVARDVVEPEAVGRERHDGRRADPARGTRVLVGEVPLPLVHHEASAGSLLVAPGEAGAVEAAARRVFELGLGGQAAGPTHSA